MPTPSSIVGSIGVISSGFGGFVDAIDKLGIERRVYGGLEQRARSIRSCLRRPKTWRGLRRCGSMS
ncbi:MAG: hypothetical protein HOP09_11245 [Hyphomicrobium sp.]|nr:hypothetical protein [Hyphomicrobium sp.]